MSFACAQPRAQVALRALGDRNRGLRPGEAVALVMRNRPDYFALWLGLTEAGAIAALVSPDLAAPALAHRAKGFSRALRNRRQGSHGERAGGNSSAR